MVQNLGNYPAGATVYFMWNTNGADGASITRSTNGTIQVYKNNGTTQDTDGVTDTEDFDGLTGVHACTIDTSADGTFYSDGGDFTVVIAGAVVDTKTVNAAIARFTLGKETTDVRKFGGTAGTFSGGRPEVNTTHAAGTAWNSGAIGASTLAADTLTAAKVHSDVGTEIGTAVWATATRTITALDEDNVTLDLDATIRGAVGLASANLDTQLGDLPTAAENGTAVWATGTRVLTAGTNIVLAKGVGVTGFNDLSAAQVNAEVDTALADIHLDHLLATTYDPASKPGAADALLNELIEDDGGVARYSANALEEAPTGGSAPTVEEIADEVETRTIAAVTTVGSVTGNVGGNVTGSVGSLATQAKADVNAEVDAAIETYHLDHLLATTYDPANKPGAADALLNELVENDGGVARYSANALEQAPTGGSAPSAATIADAVWDEARSGHVAAGSFGEGIASVQGNVTGSVASVTGNVGGNVTGSVASVTGNVGGNVAGSVASVTGNVGGNVTGSVASVTGNVAGSVASVTAAVTVGTNNDKSGYRLSATGVDDVLDEVVEGSYTFRQYLRGFAATLLAKASGLETTNAVYRDTGDSKDRVDATVDEHGNRTAVTLDLT
jgi:hypothetical protein